MSATQQQPPAAAADDGAADAHSRALVPFDSSALIEYVEPWMQSFDLIRRHTKEIKQGGFGWVRRVVIEDPKTGETIRCAVKIVKLEQIFPEDAGRLRRYKEEVNNDRVLEFENEVDILEHLWRGRQGRDLPVVRSFGAVRSSTALGLMLELCEGGDIIDWFSRQFSVELWNPLADKALVARAARRVGEFMVAKLAVDMLVALQYAHSQNVVHLDVKLSNFVFKTKALNSPVKLIDFSVSEIANVDRAGRRSVFLSGRGTAPYMGPERFSSRDCKPFEGALNWEVAQKTDVWSVGICLFELTQGRLPWDPKMGSGMASIGSQIFQRHPSQFIMSDACSLSPEAKSFVAGLLHPIATRRPFCNEALQHSWLVEALSAGEHEEGIGDSHLPTLPAESVRALLLYLRSNELKRALAFCLAARSTNLDWAVRQRLVVLFSRFDRDGDSLLEPAEVAELMDYLGGTTRDAFVLLKTHGGYGGGPFGQNANGRVGGLMLSDVISAIDSARVNSLHLSGERALRRTFDLLADEDGYVQRSEVLHRLSDCFDARTADRIVAQLYQAPAAALTHSPGGGGDTGSLDLARRNSMPSMEAPDGVPEMPASKQIKEPHRLQQEDLDPDALASQPSSQLVLPARVQLVDPDAAVESHQLIEVSDGPPQLCKLSFEQWMAALEDQQYLAGEGPTLFLPRESQVTPKSLQALLASGLDDEGFQLVPRPAGDLVVQSRALHHGQAPGRRPRTISLMHDSEPDIHGDTGPADAATSEDLLPQDLVPLAVDAKAQQLVRRGSSALIEVGGAGDLQLPGPIRKKRSLESLYYPLSQPSPAVERLRLFVLPKPEPDDGGEADESKMAEDEEREDEEEEEEDYEPPKRYIWGQSTGAY